MHTQTLASHSTGQGLQKAAAANTYAPRYKQPWGRLLQCRSYSTPQSCLQGCAKG